MPSYNEFARYRLYGGNEQIAKWWDNAKGYMRIERYGNLPKELTFQQYVKNMSNPKFGEQWQPINFSPKRLDKHYEDHVVKVLDKQKESLGNISKEQYVDKARKLLKNNKIEQFYSKK